MEEARRHAGPRATPWTVWTAWTKWTAPGSPCLVPTNHWGGRGAPHPWPRAGHIDSTVGCALEQSAAKTDIAHTSAAGALDDCSRDVQSSRFTSEHRHLTIESRPNHGRFAKIPGGAHRMPALRMRQVQCG